MDGSQMSEFEFARAAPKCEHDPPEADRIGAERSLPANRRRAYWGLELAVGDCKPRHPQNRTRGAEARIGSIRSEQQRTNSKRPNSATTRGLLQAERLAAAHVANKSCQQTLSTHPGLRVSISRSSFVPNPHLPRGEDWLGSWLLAVLVCFFYFS